MDREEVLHVLEGIRFFKEFTPEQIDTMIGDEPNVSEYGLADFVVKQGEVDSRFYVLLKGALYVTKDDLPDFVINKLKQGMVFGEMGILSKNPRSANVIVYTDATVLVIDYEKLPEEIKDVFKAQCIGLLINCIEDANRQMLKLLVI